MQLVTAQIEEAVGQAGFFRVVDIAKDRHRQFALNGGKHGHAGGIDLNLTRGDLGVHKRRIARLHPAINANDPFGADLFDVFKGRAVAVGQHLRDAVMVAQVNEQHAPMVAHPVDPARQADLMAHMGGVQGGAGMAAIGVHHLPLCGGWNWFAADTHGPAREVKGKRRSSSG